MKEKTVQYNIIHHNIIPSHIIITASADTNYLAYHYSSEGSVANNTSYHNFNFFSHFINFNFSRIYSNPIQLNIIDSTTTVLSYNATYNFKQHDKF